MTLRYTPVQSTKNSDSRPLLICWARLCRREESRGFDPARSSNDSIPTLLWEFCLPSRGVDHSRNKAKTSSKSLSHSLPFASESFFLVYWNCHWLAHMSPERCKSTFCCVCSGMRSQCVGRTACRGPLSTNKKKRGKHRYPTHVISTEESCSWEFEWFYVWCFGEILSWMSSLISHLNYVASASRNLRDNFIAIWIDKPNWRHSFAIPRSVH